MSFLTELENKRRSLKPAATVITRVDGRKFLEHKGETSLLETGQYGFVIDTKPDETPARITEYLFLGSQDCCQLKVLDNYKIKNILSVGVEPSVKYSGINYKFVHCLDLPEAKVNDFLIECVTFIEDSVKQGVNILVHCNAGVSRSSTVVIGYLMLAEHRSYSESFNLVKSARSCIKPNDGFEKQLKAIGNSLNFQ